MPWCHDAFPTLILSQGDCQQTAGWRDRGLDEVDISGWRDGTLWYFQIYYCRSLYLLTILNLEKLKWQDFSGRPIIACIAWLSHRGPKWASGWAVCLSPDSLRCYQSSRSLPSEWMLLERHGKMPFLLCPALRCPLDPISIWQASQNRVKLCLHVEGTWIFCRILLRFLFFFGFCASELPTISTLPDNPRASERTGKLRSCDLMTWGDHWLHGDSHDHLHRHGQCLNQFPQHYSARLGALVSERFPSGRSQDLWRWRSIGTRRGQDLDGYSLRRLRIWALLCNSKVSEDRCQHIHNAGCLFVTWLASVLSQRFHCLHHTSGAEKLDVQWCPVCTDPPLPGLLYSNARQIVDWRKSGNWVKRENFKVRENMRQFEKTTKLIKLRMKFFKMPYDAVSRSEIWCCPIGLLDTLIAAGNRLYYHNDLYLACSCNRAVAGFAPMPWSIVKLGSGILSFHLPCYKS